MHRRVSIESLESRQLLTVTPTFSESTSPTGKGPESVAVADFNKDGKLDFITANSNSGTVTVALGKGNGTFGSQKQIGVGSQPVAVIAADFNKDGKTDFAVALQGTDQVVTFLGDGAGNFTKIATLAAGDLFIDSYAAYGTGAKIVAGDFDGDTKIDLAVTNPAAGTVSVFLGQNNGQFGARVVSTVSQDFDLLGLTAADVNLDGKADLVVTSSYEIFTLIATGSGHFTRAQVDRANLSDTHDVTIADLTGDGILDLAVVNGDTTEVDIFKGSASGTFSFYAATGSSEDGGNAGPNALTAGDFNNDRFLDLAIANFTEGTRTILSNDGAGHFNAMVETPNYNNGYPPYPTDHSVDVATGDFNNDGKLDTIWAGGFANNVKILTNTTTGKAVYPPTVSNFTVTPNNATVGTSLVLSATASETNGTITSMRFYSGEGSNALLGTGVLTSGVWKLTVNTTGMFATNYTFYAAATDANGISSTVSQSVTLTPPSNAPAMTSFYGSGASGNLYAGSTFTLTASAAETGGTIAGMNFYRESNSTPGLQNGSDTFVGAGTFSNESWNLNTTASLTAGSYTYYAVAVDGNGVTSGPASAGVYVSRYYPFVTSFTINPSPATVGSTLTLTAAASETNGTITSVKFYRESSGTNMPQVDSDTLVGSGTLSNGVWTITTSTAGLPAGSTRYYAIATDADGVTNYKAASVNLTTASTGTPVVNSFTVNPSSYTVGASYQLITNATESGGTIANVKYYIDTDGTAGLNTATDYLVGTATSKTSTFTLTADSTPYTPGMYTVFALATDSNGKTAQKSATMTVNAAVNKTPVIDSFTISPSNTRTLGTSFNLVATASETNGTISGVKFYRESNGTGGYQSSADTFVGSGTFSGGAWQLGVTTDGLAAGNYTFYAVATDSAAHTSAAASTVATFTNPPTTTLLAWELSGQTGSGTEGLKASTVDPADINSLGLTRGSGVKHSGGASKAFGGSNWAATSAAGISGNQFITLGLTVASGWHQALSSLSFHYRRTSDGPSSLLLQYQLNNGTWVTISDSPNLFTDTTTTGGNVTLNLSGVSALQNLAGGTAVNFRLTPYGATASTGTFYIFNQTGNDLTIAGSYYTSST